MRAIVFSSMILVAFPGCSTNLSQFVDEGYALEVGAIKLVKDPALKKLVGVTQEESFDNEAFQEAISQILTRQHLDPRDYIESSLVWTAIVVTVQGEAFVIALNSPLTDFLRPWESPLRIILFDHGGKVLDKLDGYAVDGEINADLFETKSNRLACLVVAFSGSRVDIRLHGKLHAFHGLSPRYDGDPPYAKVCQVGIRNRNLVLVHPDIARVPESSE